MEGRAIHPQQQPRPPDANSQGPSTAASSAAAASASIPAKIPAAATGAAPTSPSEPPSQRRRLQQESQPPPVPTRAVKPPATPQRQREQQPQHPQPQPQREGGADAGADRPDAQPQPQPHPQAQAQPAAASAATAVPGFPSGAPLDEAVAGTPAAGAARAGGTTEQAAGREGPPSCECECPLCLHLLHAPVTTPCRHTFCGRCFRCWAEAQATHVHHPVTNTQQQQQQAGGAIAWPRRVSAQAPWGPGGGGGGGGGLMAGGGRAPSAGPTDAAGAVVVVAAAAQAAGAPEAVRQVTCPLCRRLAPAHLPEDVARAAAVRARHPAAYAARGAELGAEEEALAARRRRLRRLQLGNTHAYVAQQPGGGADASSSGTGGSSINTHEWCFFVRLAGASAEQEAELVERVEVHLHPSFSPPVVVLTRPPFLVRRRGWGEFVVRAKVVFRPRWRHPPLLCRWLLDFSDGGNMVEVELDLGPPQPQPPQQPPQQPEQPPPLAWPPSAQPAGQQQRQQQRPGAGAAGEGASYTSGTTGGSAESTGGGGAAGPPLPGTPGGGFGGSGRGPLNTRPAWLLLPAPLLPTADSSAAAAEAEAAVAATAGPHIAAAGAAGGNAAVGRNGNGDIADVGGGGGGCDGGRGGEPLQLRPSSWLSPTLRGLLGADAPHAAATAGHSTAAAGGGSERS
ncbi:hypothetical protein HXX76_001687 [Chlamydomonas incerta]|uniref:RING-type domain-containing protein n=1 Tax=Chlamydomonas incerta TaxID=51695 RepID=A0A836B1K4_CHLIN|nr:hypothetical protein HXX76_001687 [Chlamydomonas incerta]|eukprot:KAG2444951.1 hypothetical protein HXX76_001687 [Chlamydomonas incerta]